VGCGGVTPTATPNPGTPAGYRQAASGRGQQIVQAVDVARIACATGNLNGCEGGLKKEEPLVQESIAWLRSASPPAPCATLAASYAGLSNDAQSFFADLRAAIASGSTDQISTAAASGGERVEATDKALRDQLTNDPCR
jgi:hypothetical protein